MPYRNSGYIFSKNLTDQQKLKETYAIPKSTYNRDLWGKYTFGKTGRFFTHMWLETKKA